MVRAAAEPDIGKMLSTQAASVFTSTPEDFAKLIATDIERLGGAVKAAGIKMQ